VLIHSSHQASLKVCRRSALPSGTSAGHPPERSLAPTRLPCARCGGGTRSSSRGTQYELNVLCSLLIRSCLLRAVLYFLSAISTLRAPSICLPLVAHSYISHTDCYHATMLSSLCVVPKRRDTKHNLAEWPDAAQASPPTYPHGAFRRLSLHVHDNASCLNQSEKASAFCPCYPSSCLTLRHPPRTLLVR
jgi:hypothetical protein